MTRRVLRRGVVHEYRATQAETTERYFTCRHCGARGEVRFHAEGDSGWHRESMFLDDTETRVHEAAAEDLMVDAERVLHLIRCPTCGRRDPAYVRWAGIRVGAWFALGGGMLVFGGLHFVIGAIITSVLGGWQAWREHSRFERADQAMLLRLQPGTPPALPQPAPPPPEPVVVPAPVLPVARAITAPPIAPFAPRGPDEEPAFLRKKD